MSFQKTDPKLMSGMDCTCFSIYFTLLFRNTTL